MPLGMVQGLLTSALTSVLTGALNQKKQKAMIINCDTDETIELQFNPSEYSLIEGADYTKIPRQNNDSPVLNFAGGQTPRLKMSFYFDTYELKSASIESTVGSIGTSLGLTDSKEADVSEQVEKLAKLRAISGKVHRPPLVAFQWGSLNFNGYVNSVTSTYSMFDKSGKPLRAKVDIEFIGEADDDGARVSPFESPDRTKIRVLSEDESLWNIAHKEYGDAGKWRCIAEANGIMDPLAIPAGTILKVPAI